MDLFPDLGEPGFLDELFYFGPLVLQLILGAFFFWLLGRWMKNVRWVVRAVAVVGMIFVTDLLLIVAFGVVCKIANPTLL